MAPAAPDPAALDVEALVFDAYGTLFDVHSVIAACERAFPDRGRALSEAWRRRQLEHTWLRALMGRYRDFWQVTGEALDQALAELGLEADAATREGIVQSYLSLEPYPEVPAALDALGGYRKAVLSNGAPAMLSVVLRGSGLDRHFEAVLSADAVRTFKPEPRVYAEALAALKLPRHRIGFVSANAWDAAGAAAFGFGVVWLNRGDRPWDGLGPVPARTARDLAGLADLLT